MDKYRRSMLIKAFITPQFSYCSLVSMFQSRNTENNVDKMNERAMKLLYFESP